MDATQLSSLLVNQALGQEATVYLDEYAYSILRQIRGEAAVWRARHFAGLTYWEGIQFTRLPERTYTFDSFTLTSEAFTIKGGYVYEQGYEYDTFPRAVFDETDDARRLVLIQAVFQAKLTEYRAKQTQAGLAKQESDRAELARLKALYPDT